VSAHTITHLVHEYGLALVFLAVALQAVGVPVPGTTALVAAAVYAATAHGLPIAGVIVAGILGAMVGTSAGYALGRLGGEPLLLWVGRRLRVRPERIEALRRELASHGTGWLLMSRFVTGLRNAAGILAGASAMPLRRFLTVSFVAATLWAVSAALEYYWFGAALAGAATWLQILLIALGIAWTLISLRLLRRRVTRRVTLPDLSREL
jgi:membrane protein DedA with SNARE-associated domain